MVAEAVQPIIKELPENEKRKLFKWLGSQLSETPQKTNPKLREHLTKLCFKK